MNIYVPGGCVHRIRAKNTEKKQEFNVTEKPAAGHKPVTKTSDKIGSCKKELEKESLLFL